tara:strand:+ start:213 stop:476 length:264 start_codon:yes stop_codon:yes gene_type:complete
MIATNVSIVVFSVGLMIFLMDCVFSLLPKSKPTISEWVGSLSISIIIISISLFIGNTTTYTCHNGHCGYPEEDIELFEKIYEHNNQY